MEDNQLEYFIRTTLGQEFDSYSEFLSFKVEKELSGKFPDLHSVEKSKHLRFDMSGERDGEEGLAPNIRIIEKFDLPITVRSSYEYEDQRRFDKEYILIFSKGCGCLFKRIDGELEEVNYGYGGLGTVEIIMDLFKVCGGV